MTAFASRKELAKATAEWPASRPVEIWKSFAGTSGFDKLKPIKKSTDRKAATTEAAPHGTVPSAEIARARAVLKALKPAVAQSAGAPQS